MTHLRMPERFRGRSLIIAHPITGAPLHFAAPFGDLGFFAGASPRRELSC